MNKRTRNIDKLASAGIALIVPDCPDGYLVRVIFSDDSASDFEYATRRQAESFYGKAQCPPAKQVQFFSVTDEEATLIKEA